MSLDLDSLISKRTGENISLHAQYINPQFAKVLQTIGFDKVYTKAEGPYLWDNQGKRYTDFLAGYGVYSIGRNHPEMKRVIKEYLDRDEANLIQMEAPLLSGLLAERLVKKVNVDGLNKVFFTNSGTEAVEGAIKYARAATGKNRILFLDHSFHGLSTGSLSLNGNTEFRDGFGELLPGNAICQNDITALETELKKGDVAAFFFEPIQGKGVYVPNDTFLPEAQALCKKYSALFVADEIQTGFCRTGKWFAFEHWNLQPDIITLSKALSGGMVPVGALVCRDWIYQKVFSRMDRCVVHSSTFGQNNLAMLSGLAAIQIMEDEKLDERARITGDFLKKELEALIPKHEWMSEVRGRGLMIGIEFGKPTSFKKKLSWNLVHQMDKGLFGELIVMPLLSKHSILTQVSGHHQDVVKLIPPLILTEEDCKHFVLALDSILAECDQISGPIWSMGKNLMKHALQSKKTANG